MKPWIHGNYYIYDPIYTYRLSDAKLEGFNLYHNVLKSIICTAKTVYFTKRFFDCSKNIQQTWVVIKEVSWLPHCSQSTYHKKGQVQHHMNKFIAEIGKRNCQ